MPFSSDGINGIGTGDSAANLGRALVALVQRLAYLSVGAARSEAERNIKTILNEARRHTNYQQWLEALRSQLSDQEQELFTNVITQAAVPGWIDP